MTSTSSVAPDSIRARSSRRYSSRCSSATVGLKVPIASSALQPNSFSAAPFQAVTVPAASQAITGIGMLRTSAW